MKFYKLVTSDVDIIKDEISSNLYYYLTNILYQVIEKHKIIYIGLKILAYEENIKHTDYDSWNNNHTDYYSWNNNYGWNEFDLDGYKYYIEKDYKYCGNLGRICKIKQRKKKLEKILK